MHCTMLEEEKRLRRSFVLHVHLINSNQFMLYVLVYCRHRLLELFHLQLTC